jgi:hypothetical protein
MIKKALHAVYTLHRKLLDDWNRAFTPAQS